VSERVRLMPLTAACGRYVDAIYPPKTAANPSR
jgi:hypothetical protein